LKCDRAPTRMLTAVGVAAWAAVILAPLSALYLPACWPSGQVAYPHSQAGLVLYSIELAAILAAVSVVLGYIPGRILATARAHQTALLLLFLMPLLLPRYVLYYAWSLLLSPSTPLGDWLARDGGAARLAGMGSSCMVMVLWYWPLAALLIAQGWRRLDRDTCDSARLEAGPLQRLTRVTLPQLAWPLALAFGVCFALLLGEFGTFHLAGVRTIGTELAVMYELTGSEAAVAKAALPIGLVGLLMGFALWNRSQRWASDSPTGPAHASRSRWTWAVLPVLAGLSLPAPIGLLIASLETAAPVRRFLTLHLDGLAWSLATAGGAAAITVVIAFAALSVEKVKLVGRALSGLMHTTIFLAMFLPGSIVAVALLKLLTSMGPAAGLRQSWAVVSAGQAARFAGIALILLRLARDGREKHLSEMAAVDGAGPVKAWLYVHLPRSWPVLVGAFLVVAMFSVTELPASMVLLPAGLASFPQRLLNQMHYARDQQVIASCLILLAAYLVLSAAVVCLLRIVRARHAVAIILCVAMGLAGCDAQPDASAGKADVLYAFGRTGTGRCEFVYPRAIDLAPDGSLLVVDKNGIIRRLTRKGEFLAMIRMPQIEAGKPTGLTVGPDGNLYVADTHYHRVVVFSPDGKIIRQFGRFGEGPGEFIYPTDVEFADDGRIYVSEYGGNDRVSVFSPEGRFLASFGTPGDGPEQFAKPSALCVDRRRRRLYVADACNHRIAVYSLDGDLQKLIGTIGQGPGQMRYPYDLALTADGTLVVCEYGNNRLQLFSPQGRPLGTFGGPGRQLGKLAYPWAVAVDENQRAYVVDAGNNRIQVWQLPAHPKGVGA